MTCVLAIDQGTTGSTCLMIGADGRVLGRGYREITQHYPSPGWVEHDAREIWIVIPLLVPADKPSTLIPALVLE